MATVAGLSAVALAGCQDDTEEIIEQEEENISDEIEGDGDEPDDDGLDDVELADGEEDDENE